MERIYPNYFSRIGQDDAAVEKRILLSGSYRRMRVAAVSARVTYASGEQACDSLSVPCAAPAR